MTEFDQRATRQESAPAASAAAPPLEALVSPKVSPSIDTPFAERVFAHQLTLAFPGETPQWVQREMDEFAAKAPALWNRLVARLKEDHEVAGRAGQSLNDYYAAGSPEVLQQAHEHCVLNGITARRAQVPGRDHEALEILPSDATPLNRKVKECLEQEPEQRVFFDPRSTSERGSLGLHDAQSKVVFAPETAIAFGAFKSIDPTRCFGHELDHFEFTQLLKQGLVSPFHIGFAVQQGPGFPGLEPWNKGFVGEEIVNLSRDVAERKRRVERWENSATEEVQFLRQLCVSLNTLGQKSCEEMTGIATRTAAAIMLDHPNVEYAPGLLTDLGKFKGMPDIFLSAASVRDSLSANQMVVFIPLHRSELDTLLPGVTGRTREQGEEMINLEENEKEVVRNLTKKKMEELVVALCGNKADHLEIIKQAALQR